MKKRKDPFVNYTTEQIFISESMLWVVQIGEDVFEDENGQWFFVQKKANSYYNQILKDLLHSIYKGNLKQQKEAKKLLADLRMLPFRMH